MFNFFLYFFLAGIFAIIVFVIFVFWRIKEKKKKQIEDSLKLVLYEITFPRGKSDDDNKEMKKGISAMENFYTAMVSLGSFFSLEIGLPYKGEQVVFYCSVPRERKQLFEKQIQGLLPEAKVNIKTQDYNIFKPMGFSSASVARFSTTPVLPIKTYEKFEENPINLMINVFSKLQKEGEGAALQMIVSSEKSDLLKKVKSVSLDMRSGKKFNEALRKARKSFLEKTVEEIFKIFFASQDQDKNKEKDTHPVDEEALKLLETKSSRFIMKANIRLLASAESQIQADTILDELESSFAQFGEAQGNSFRFDRPRGIKLKKLFYDFSFRVPNKNTFLELNTAELATVFNFPNISKLEVNPYLKFTGFKEAAPPLNLPDTGVLLGESSFRGESRPVYMKDEDRVRHMYIIGQTGTGKTTIMKNMIIQDIEAGKGVCYIDPHGSDVQDILSRIPPERADDLIYFNPGDVSRPMGLNMMEFDPKYPEQKTFVVNELFSIFKKIYGATPEAMGPAFEQYFRNSAMLVMEDPESGNTLVDISRVLSDKTYREYKLARCKNPLVRQFWENAIKTTGDQGLANYVQYVTNKFDVFLMNDIMRPIIGQEKSAFNFREIMDSKKILLLDLSKGRLGDINSSLIGLIVIGKILMAALSRVDIPDSERNNFYLYIDEFQNVTTDSISSILSEARKYKLNLIIAHQYIGQLPEDIKNAVFGNVGSMAVYRVGSEDAEFLKVRFTPVFDVNDLINIDNYNTCLQLLIAGQPAQPFNIRVPNFRKGDIAVGKKMAELSSLKYGRPREEVEEEIMEKYNKKLSVTPPIA